MAHAAGTSARTHRLIGLVAALALASTTALAFGRVFLGATTTLKLLGTALAAAGLAVLLERRSLVLSTVMSAAGLALAVSLLVFPDTTWYGLPSKDTLSAALDAAAVVGEQARIQIAPAEPIAPLLLAAVVSLWAAVFSAHALAFRAGSPLLGLIPPVALVAFADTVLEEFVKPLYGVAFLAAALLVVFADGLARVQGWGPVWTSARRGVAATAGRGARKLAFAAIAAAVVAPIVVPGFGSRAVIDFGTAAEDRVSIDPFVSVKSSLSRKDPVEVLRITSPRPTYVRLVSLPDFDGATWSPERDDRGLPVASGQPVTGQPPAEDPQTVGVEVVTDLGDPWLPTVYPFRSIDAPGVSISYEPDTGTAFLDSPLEEGDRYSIETTFADPIADELREIEVFSSAASQRYLSLPADMPARIEEIARDWTRGRDTVFDQVVAIQDRLRDPTVFSYSEDVAPKAGARTIAEFLDVSRTGFCQQFATSMAVLLRELGIPARVVVGFALGREIRPGEYSVTSDRAHSWVEVLFPGQGWLPFEPTPGRVNPVTYTNPGSDCVGDACPEVDPVPGPEGASPPSRNRVENIPPQLPVLTGPRGAVGGPGTLEGVDDSRGGARALLLLGAAAAGLVLLLVPVGRAFLRRSRRRRVAAEPRRLILLTHEQFSEQVAGVGLGRHPGETLEEYRRRVTGTGYLSDGHLDRLTRLATHAAYARNQPDRVDVDAATEAADTALREIRRSVGPTRWFVGQYRRG